MTELERARILTILYNVIDDATSQDNFPAINFQWQENTTENMALAALKVLEKEVKAQVTG